MKILDKAAKLEKALLDRFSRRTDIARHPIEIYRDVLDEIEHAAEPGARGGMVFPYHAITVVLPVTSGRQRATAEAVFAEAPPLEERVSARLRQAGCAGVEQLTVALKFVDGTAAAWSGREYQVDFRRRAAARRASEAGKARAERGHELHLVVTAGAAAKSRYSFATSRINLGRLADVLDRHERVIRQNHVAFADAADGVNLSVSRTHAHICFDAATGETRLLDDGSTHGTRVVRAGRTIAVPRGGGRGLALHDGDEVVLGQARLRVELRPARRR